MLQIVTLIIIITVAVILVIFVRRLIKQNSLSQLEKLHELKQKGVITEEEFNKRKNELV